MNNERYEFNGYYAVVDDCDNVFFESESEDEALNYFVEHPDNENLFLTREMELYRFGINQIGFAKFERVGIQY